MSSVGGGSTQTWFGDYTGAKESFKKFTDFEEVSSDPELNALPTLKRKKLTRNGPELGEAHALKIQTKTENGRAKVDAYISTKSQIALQEEKSANAPDAMRDKRDRLRYWKQG